jgi:hypothetical protein
MEIVDTQNIEALKFHKRVFFLYFCFTFVPVLVYMVLEDSTETHSARVALLSLSQFSHCILLLFEIFQLKHAGGLLEYLEEDQWNFVDMFHFLLFTSFYIQQICYGFKDRAELLSIVDALMKLFVISLAFLKLLFFLRVFEEMGSLVQMLQTTVGSMIPFMIFLSISVLFFAFCFSSLGISYAGGDYANIDNFMAILI